MREIAVITNNAGRYYSRETVTFTRENPDEFYTIATENGEKEAKKMLAAA